MGPESGTDPRLAQPRQDPRSRPARAQDQQRRERSQGVLRLE